MIQLLNFFWWQFGPFYLQNKIRQRMVLHCIVKNMYSVHLHPLINITSKTKQFVVELNILVPNHRWTMGNVSLGKPKLFCMYGKPTGGSGGQGGRSSLKGGLKLKSLVSHHSLIMNGLRSIIADLRLVRGLFNF